MIFAVLMLVVPVAQSDADVPGFRATYEDLSQEELVSLLGDVYVEMASREVLETIGMNVSGEGSPFDVSRMIISGTDFGLDYTSSLHEGVDGRSLNVSAHYSFYLDFDFELEAVAESDGYDAFDEGVCGLVFGFEELSEGDRIRMKGTVSIVAEDDMRDTAVRQSYDRDVCALDSTTLIGTFSCVFRIVVETVHEGVHGEVEAFGHKDVGAVTVVDYIYRADAEDVRPGAEVFCIWTSREDSADVRIEFEGMIDGTGSFTFRDRKIYYEHFNWQYPSRVKIDGRLWNDLDRPFDLGFVPDFASARAVGRSGRNTMKLIPHRDRLVLFIDDSDPAASQYRITIVVKRSARNGE
ncbi:MAG: hypothetical protein J5674_04320 [Candidatus Methanomethylophilaceae archaeon]|nr:hypothetical protein [Candidatus Methanomethylophilaceae archaeon]